MNFQEIIHLLQEYDTKAFYFVNHALQNPIFDILMPIITDFNQYRIVIVGAITLLVWMLIRGKPNVRLAAILLIIAVLISDQLNSFVIKQIFMRPRPCHVLPDVHLLVGCGKGYSFPSSHAVNNFTAAIVLAYCIPRYRWWFWSIATIVLFSRVYVGVHYPLDVIAGGLLGLIIGGSVLLLYLLFERTLISYKLSRHRRTS
ncbi:MAG: phosphatase PAP2 family protein [Bacteroidetes bacterium]|nr:phosphatase PAP2 family protein [Bacteroidota bacterium]